MYSCSFSGDQRFKGPFGASSRLPFVADPTHTGERSSTGGICVLAQMKFDMRRSTSVGSDSISGGSFACTAADDGSATRNSAAKGCYGRQ